MKIKSRIRIGSGCLRLGTRSRSDPVGASRMLGIFTKFHLAKSQKVLLTFVHHRVIGVARVPFGSSGYLTKYIHKDFENSAKGAKRYWHTRGIGPIKCIKFWLGATSFIDALREARDAVVEQGIVEMKIWADEDIGNTWIAATAPHYHDARFVRPCPF